MLKYATKVVFVEALRWDGEPTTFQSLTRLLGDTIALRPNATLVVLTPEGPRSAELGDWVVKERSGAAFPMNDSMFSRKFEPWASNSRTIPELEVV